MSSPAVSVFAVLKAAKELKTRDQAELMHDLIHVICAPTSGPEYLQDLIHMWKVRAEDAIPEFAPKRVTYQADGTASVPWPLATQIMIQQLTVKKALEYGR